MRSGQLAIIKKNPSFPSTRLVEQFPAFEEGDLKLFDLSSYKSLVISGLQLLLEESGAEPFYEAKMGKEINEQVRDKDSSSFLKVSIDTSESSSNLSIEAKIANLHLDLKVRGGGHPKSLVEGKQNQIVQSDCTSVDDRYHIEMEEPHDTCLYEKVVPTVVSVETTFSNGKHGKDRSIFGSGVVINKKGFFLTCAHVVPDDKKHEYDYKTTNVFFSNGETYMAKLIAKDKGKDLALLKIINGKPEFPYAKFAKSEEIKTARRAYLISNPHGYDFSFSKGSVRYANSHINLCG